MTTETSSEDFLELELENFNGAANSADELDSYLLLGADDETETHGDDLTSLVTSQSPVFIDDARVRGASDAASPDSTASKNTFHTMTQTERATESALLTTKGGWRDHTDGNRITTTRGDKIEVIRGNYKLRVLGREQWTGNAGSGLHEESSGGITYGYDEVPGQYVDVRWEYDDAIQTWRVIEECVKGHTVTRYHGVDKDWVQGGDFVTRVGSLKAYDGTTSSDDPDDFMVDTHFDKPTDASHQASTAWPCDDVLPNIRERTFAKSVYEKTIAHDIKEYLGSETRKLTKCVENQYCHVLKENQTFDTFEQLKEGGESYEYWFGPSYFELFDGDAYSEKFHTYFDFRCGISISEVNFVSIGEINAALVNVNVEICAMKNDLVIAPAINEINLTLLRIITKSRPETEVKICSQEAAVIESIA